jgi:AAHS family 4-hydroxybenzoate transporter-like MFS transporter
VQSRFAEPTSKPSIPEYKLVILVTCIMLLDGYDMQAAAFAAPAIRADWGIAPSALGPMLAAALVGMALGTAIGGYVGDRYGRRPALLAGVLTFSGFALLCAISKDLTWLTLMRFFTGIGMGAVIPNAMALVSETVSDRWRNLSMTVSLAAVPCGGMIGAGISSFVIPEFGWRASLAVGGVLPLCLLVLLWRWLPESVRFTGNTATDLSAGHERGESTLGILFSKAHLRVTAALWLAFFGSMIIHYSYLSWLPTMLSSSGMGTGDAVRGLMYFNLFGVAGSLAGSWVIDRRGSRDLLLFTCFLIALGTLVIGSQLGRETSYSVLVVGIAIAGCGAATLQVTLFALAAHAYPDHCRARGIGWSAGIGRAGAILSAALGGFILQLDEGISMFLAAIGSVTLIVILGVVAMDRHIPSITAKPKHLD